VKNNVKEVIQAIEHLEEGLAIVDLLEVYFREIDQPLAELDVDTIEKSFNTIKKKIRTARSLMIPQDQLLELGPQSFGHSL